MAKPKKQKSGSKKTGAAKKSTRPYPSKTLEEALKIHSRFGFAAHERPHQGGLGQSDHGQEFHADSCGPNRL